MECNTSRVEYNWELQEFVLGEFVFDLSGLYAYLERLTDGRDPRRVRYRLADALALIILAKLGGEDEARGIADWLKHRAELLVEALRLPRSSMPHEVTISRILGTAVEPEELEQVLQRYFDGQAQMGQEVVIAIDGKTLRGTICPLIFRASPAKIMVTAGMKPGPSLPAVCSKIFWTGLTWSRFLNLIIGLSILRPVKFRAKFIMA